MGSILTHVVLDTLSSYMVGGQHNPWDDLQIGIEENDLQFMIQNESHMVLHGACNQRMREEQQQEEQQHRGRGRVGLQNKAAHIMHSHNHFCVLHVM